ASSMITPSASSEASISLTSEWNRMLIRVALSRDERVRQERDSRDSFNGEGTKSAKKNAKKIIRGIPSRLSLRLRVFAVSDQQFARNASSFARYSSGLALNPDTCFAPPTFQKTLCGFCCWATAA